MMNATETATLPTWRLVRITDLRDIDFASGKRLPLAAGEGHVCDRCAREHAIVFHITDGVRSLAVGSGCVEVATDGWEPSATEVKRARKVAQAVSEAKHQARLEAGAKPYVDAVLAHIRTNGWPTIELDTDRTWSAATGQRWWNMGGARVGDFGRGPKPDAERVAVLRDAYASHLLYRVLFPLPQGAVFDQALDRDRVVRGYAMNLIRGAIREM